MLWKNTAEALNLARQKAALVLIPLLAQLSPLTIRAADESPASVAPSMVQLSASYNQGNAYLINGEFDKAFLEFDRVISANPSANADFYLSRGIVNEKLLHWDAALSDYNTALKLSNKNIFSKEDPVIGNDYQSLNYNGIIGILVNEIKELKKENHIMKDEIQKIKKILYNISGYTLEEK